MMPDWCQDDFLDCVIQGLVDHEVDDLDELAVLPWDERRMVLRDLHRELDGDVPQWLHDRIARARA